MNYFWQLRREFTAFFYSPVAYVVIGISAILNAATFFLILRFLSGAGPTAGAPMEMLFSTALFWLIVMTLTPLITMRTFAEEKHAGTLETLVTAPISDTRIVLAKYTAALAFYAIMWAPTLLYPVLLTRWTPVDPGPVLSGYTGTLAMGAMLVSIGVLCSALTRNQIVAAIITFAAMMGMFLAGLFSYVDGVSQAAVFQYVNLSSHMESFARGIVDTRPLVYYASVAAMALFLTVQVIGARRWRR